MFGLLLPRSLVGRVFGLYCLAMVLFVGTGLALFYRFQFTVHLDDAQVHAETLTAVVAPAVADSAVIGDYDTIQKTLERAIRDWRYSTAAFIDLKGGVVRARHDEPPAIEPPDWLVQRFEAHLYDSNLPITVGGQDYGVLRLSFAPERIAAALWRQTRYALWLACGGLVLGLLLIRWPLGNWLGNLDRIRSLEEGLSAGTSGSQRALEADAPIEFRQTFEVLNRAAATLQAQREQAAVTLGAIADGVITLDRLGHIIAANPAACQMLACEPGDLLGQAAHMALPEVFPREQAPAPWIGRRSEVHRGGRAYVLDTALTAVRSPAVEEAAGYVLAFRDISEQHALDIQLRSEVRSREAALHALRGVLEGLLPANTLGNQADGTLDNLEAISALIAALVSQLQARGEQLNAIFALSPDGFVSFDRDHGINYVSSAFVALTGLNEDEVLGRDEATLVSLLRGHADPHAPSLDLAILRQPLPDGTPARCVIELARPTRRILELALNQGNAGNITQVLHLRDITHETEVDRMKSEFLSTAAHELRTPMTSIHGFVELLLMRDMPAERRNDVLQTVRRQSTLMIAILNELLDLARIEARQGKDFELVQMDLAQLAHEAIEGLNPPDQREPPRLVTGTPLDHLRVRVDRMKMMQALGNVLSNAYKYSHAPGRVTVRLVAATTAPHGPQVGVCIEDEGIGMTSEQLARVTERFYRADGSGNVPGTGLGMSIVKEVLNLHGGRLAMRSSYGEGSQITLWLPAMSLA
jgi:signal transduction histidine kinase